MITPKKKPLLRFRVKDLPQKSVEQKKYPDPENWLGKKYEWDATKQFFIEQQKRRIAQILKSSREKQKYNTIEPVTAKLTKATQRLKKKFNIIFDFHNPTHKSSRKKLHCLLNYGHTKHANKEKFSNSIISRNITPKNLDYTY